MNGQKTVPYTLRNPLYHWTHLELKRYFDVDEVLSPITAKKIYHECSEKLRTKEYSVRNLLRKMNVKVVLYYDDPTDSLEHHRSIKGRRIEIRILPASDRQGDEMLMTSRPLINMWPA
jgi:glucuronate isomerase